MRNWDQLDIIDILKEYHSDLTKASVELADGGDHEGSDKLDDKATVVENHLLELGLEWTGLAFTPVQAPGKPVSATNQGEHHHA